MAIDFIEVKKFMLDIEDIIKVEEINHIEAIVFYCEERDIEIEAVVPLIKANSVLKSQLFEEATNLHMVKKIARLAI